ASSAVTGTRSWTRSSPTAHHSSMTPTASARSPPSGWMRPSSPAPALGAPSSGAPRSSMSDAQPSCSMSCPAAPLLALRPGSTPGLRRGGPGSAGGVLDLSGPYRKTFTDSLPQAGQVADPFHLVKHANSKLDECRRRVQNETLGHRGRRDDPL